MAHRKTERNPLFAGRWFEDDIILLCLRWYFRFKLSYRDLVAILGERGLSISHTTILRWVVRYADTCEKRWRRFERPVGGSWRVDETFIKIRGQLMYLYRAVQGSQFTGFAFSGRLQAAGVRISMDGRGRCLDNIFIERLWRSLKYEAVCLHELTDGFEARRLIDEWIGFYNTERPHSALDGKTPAEAYRGDPLVGMMDKPLRALPTYPQAQQQRQEDLSKEILAV